MKLFSKAILMTVFALLCCAFLPAGDCAMYVPAKEGTVLELKSYSEKDKLTGTTRLKVMSVKTAGSGQTIQMHAESFDKKDKPAGTSDYQVVCEGGTFYLDMRTMVSQDQTEAFKDMKLNVEADKLDIPADPQPGQSLKNGAVTMTASTEGSPINMKMAMTVTNRKVAAVEDVTVPAGTFKCVKITYDAEIKNIFTIRVKVAEWYSKEVGMVRSETYNTKDKLQGYTVLNSKS